ncbi:MAG: ABC transporter ATP-binding protein [Stomatobaculum sp.]
METIRILKQYVGAYRRDSLLSVVCMIGEVVMDILIPLAMARLIDEGISGGNMPAVLRYGALMALGAVLGLLLGAGGGRFSARASAGLAANLREAMYEKIQHYSFSNIDKYSTAGLVTRLTTDVTNVQNAYQMLLRACMRSPAIMVLALCMTVMISPKLSLIFFAAILFLILVTALIIRRAMGMFSRVFTKYDEMNAAVQENVTGIRAVKSFVREEHENKKFRAAADQIYRLFVEAERLVCFSLPAMLFTVYACIIAISWQGAHEIVAGRLSTGQLTSLFTYATNILVSLMMLSMAFVMLTLSVASGRRIVEVLTEEPAIRAPETAVTEVADGSICFENVDFSYGRRQLPVDWDDREAVRRFRRRQREREALRRGRASAAELRRETASGGTDCDGTESKGTERGGRNVLSGINLRIRSGEVIGIIGGTGSSKTSLVSLIPRLYDVTAGAVRVGGRDVREYDLRALRNAVGMVLQKNMLFSGTIYENLRWGNENASEEACREACRLACADAFIRSFPAGYHTRLEQGGSNLSGGQRQRLCIARALLKQPKILILDDSTSAVDTTTDAAIRRAFRESIPDTTRLIISQRVSGVRDADRIIVLEDGKISGFGTHEELLRSNEIYRAVAEAQTEGSGDFDEREGA